MSYPRRVSDHKALDRKSMYIDDPAIARQDREFVAEGKSILSHIQKMNSDSKKAALDMEAAKKGDMPDMSQREQNRRQANLNYQKYIHRFHM